MGETHNVRQLLLRDGTIVNGPRAIVVFENYIILVGLTGKYEELIPWPSILQVKLL